MRKIFIVLLSLLLMCSLTGIVVAQETTTFITIGGGDLDTMTKTHEENVDVTLTISQSFTVTIPDGFVFSKNNNGEYTALGAVGATVSLLDVGEKLVIKISSSDYVSDGNKWLLKDDDATIPSVEYKMRLFQHVDLSGTDFVSNDQEIISLSYDDYEPESVPLHLKVSGNTGIGEYEDQLTFTVSVVAAP